MTERELTTIEHLFAYSPFSIVGVIAKIKGGISEDVLRIAVNRIWRKHPVLGCRIANNESGSLCFNKALVTDLPIEIIERKSPKQWIEVLESQCKIPFDFDKQAPIRFILVHSAEESELIVLCHHIICDGVSLAALTKDLLVYLGDAAAAIQTMPESKPISLQNIPSGLSLNGIVKLVINKMNKKWQGQKVIFDQKDYLTLNDTYWKNYLHKTISIELNVEETNKVVANCKKNGVSVNSALASSIVGAQVLTQEHKSSHSSIGVAVDLRTKLPFSPVENLGFYAGMVNMKFKYDVRKSFWDNTRNFNKSIKPKMTNKNLFKDFLSWLHLDPSIIAAINFKKFGGMNKFENPSGEKLRNFNVAKDVVLSTLKRDKLDSTTHKIMGTALTNLTKLDFPKSFGELELDRLILYPGGAFPLSNVNMVVGAVTCLGKLTLVVEYEAGTYSSASVDAIINKALNLLA